MKTCPNLLDLSLAKVDKMFESSRFIASKTLSNVAIISIYRQQKSKECVNHLDLSLAKIAKMSCVLRNPCKKFNFTFSCKNLNSYFPAEILIQNNTGTEN